MTTQQTPNAVLALAQYTYTRVEPLFAKAKKIEPSIQFDLNLIFADENSVYQHESHIKVYSHWGRDGMFQSSDWLQTMEEVDKYAAELAADVTALARLAVAA